VLLSFEGRIDELEMPPPRTWVVPFPEIQQFIRDYRTRTNVSRAGLIAEGAEFENAWELIASADPR
jgi:hypothetical protein